MSTLIRYTLLRLLIFVICFGVLWLLFGTTMVSNWLLALLALLFTSGLSMLLLRGQGAQAAEELRTVMSRGATRFERSVSESASKEDAELDQAELDQAELDQAELDQAELDQAELDQSAQSRSERSQSERSDVEQSQSEQSQSEPFQTAQDQDEESAVHRERRG